MPVTVDTSNAILNRHPFSDWLPYRGYENGLFFTEDGGVGFIFVCQPLTGAGGDTIKMMRSIFEMDIAADATIQISLHAASNITNYLDAYVGVRKEGTIFKDMAIKKKEMYQQKKSLIKSFEYRPRDFNVYVSVKLPGGNTPNAVEQVIKKAHEIKNGVEQTLKIMSMHPEALDASGLLKLLYELLNPNHDPYHGPIGYDPEMPLNRQAVWADNVIKLDKDGFKLDGCYVKSLSVKQYPESFSLWDMIELVGDTYQNLRQVMHPFWITLNACVLDYEAARSKLNIRSAFVTNQALGPLVTLIPMLAVKKQHFDRFNIALGNGEKPIKAFLNVFVFTPDIDSAQRASKSVQIICRSKNFVMQEDNFISLGLFKLSLPLGLSCDTKTHFSLKRAKTIRSVNAVNLSPIMADWKGTGTPTFLLTSRRGQIMTFDMFDNVQGNYNMAVAAASGSGKSFFSNELICSYLGLGGRVWMIDAGKSYIKLNQQLNGEYIEFKKGENKWCLNPFTKIVDMDDSEMAMLKALFAQMASPSKVLDDLQMSWIEMAIKTVYDTAGREGNPTEVAIVLLSSTDQRVRDLGDMLYPYTVKGAFGQMFNGKNNMEFNNSFVVLELDGLDDRLDLRSVVLLQLVMNINADMYQNCSRDMKKLLMLDEAWDLLSQGGNMAQFFEKGARRVRKYGGSLITITQGIDDYYDKMKDTGKAILNNSDFICLLRQKAESIQALKTSGRLLLDEHMFELLRSVHTSSGDYSEVFIYSPIGMGIGRLIVDRFSYWLYTTKPDEVEKIKGFVDKGLNMAEAINEIIKQEEAVHRHRRQNDVQCNNA